jgi:uncharacterized protein (TIGR03435 family)
MTNFEGRYDISLGVSMEDMAGMERMIGGGMMMMHQGGGDGGRAPETSTPAPSIFSAVQKLGLKLDSRKAPLDILIVDAAEKPTEN